MNLLNTKPLKVSVVMATILALSGCATVDRKHSLQQSGEVLTQVTQAALPADLAEQMQQPQDLGLQQTQQIAAEINALLANELSQQDAVQLFLTHSPAFKSTLAKAWREQAEVAQSGRIPNPVFSFERVTSEHGLEIGRVLSFGLLDLLTVPAKHQAAENFIQASNIKLSSELVEQVVAVQHAWVDAVLAQQKLKYAQKVLKAAEASSILAERMQGAGNFTRMQAVRQQLFYSDSAMNLANSQHEFIAKKEHLVRLLGLNQQQSQQLKLPNAFPALPAQPLMANEVAKLATNRLDVNLAQQQYKALLERYGVDNVSSFIDVELGLIREYERGEDESASGNGYELELKLPLFDWGDLKREAMRANLQAAQFHLQDVVNATNSHLREGYSAYRTAYDIAHHFKKEVEPMQQILAEENTYLYNGMFIGVFQLIQDSRNQVSAYESSMQAQANYWKALANLNATIVGKPSMGGLNMSVSAGAAAGGDDH